MDVKNVVIGGLAGALLIALYTKYHTDKFNYDNYKSNVENKEKYCSEQSYSDLNCEFATERVAEYEAVSYTAEEISADIDIAISEINAQYEIIKNLKIDNDIQAYYDSYIEYIDAELAYLNDMKNTANSLGTITVKNYEPEFVPAIADTKDAMNDALSVVSSASSATDTSSSGESTTE